MNQSSANIQIANDKELGGMVKLLRYRNLEENFVFRKLWAGKAVSRCQSLTPRWCKRVLVIRTQIKTPGFSRVPWSIFQQNFEGNLFSLFYTGEQATEILCICQKQMSRLQNE